MGLLYIPLDIVIKKVARTKLVNDYYGLVLTEKNTRNIPKPTKSFDGEQEHMLSSIICTKECVLEILGH